MKESLGNIKDSVIILLLLFFERPLNLKFQGLFRFINGSENLMANGFLQNAYCKARKVFIVKDNS